MAKPVKPPPPPAVPAGMVWLCEGCGTPNDGLSPPDACSMCGHGYFENLQDMLDERLQFQWEQ